MGIASFPPARFPCPVPPDGEYELVGKLGEGGQGAVYLAEKTSEPGRPLAIKFCTPKAPGGRSLSDEELRLHLRLFRDEAEHLLAHRSPCLAPARAVLDFSAFRGEGWPPLGIVMEYFESTLLQVLQDCRTRQVKLPTDLVTRWVQGLARARVAVDDAGIVHRDVVPQNLGVRCRRRGDQVGSDLVLFDFGASCRVNRAAVEVYQDHPARWPAPDRPWKDPAFYRPEGGPPPAEPAPAPAADLYAFGRVLQALAEVVDGPTRWLDQAAARCVDLPPAERPSAVYLLPMLHPQADRRTHFAEKANWDRDDRRDFVGRKAVFERFEQFAGRCKGGPGGVFLIIGPSGVGKSALLSEWVHRLGMAPCFFFRYKKQIAGDALPIALEEWLAAEYGVERKPPGHTWQTSDLEDMLQKAAGNLAGGQLVLFIDALDEAGRPEEAVKWIPWKEQPPGIFLVVTSRPPGKRPGHLPDWAWKPDSEPPGWADCFPLRPNDPDNRKDIRDYFEAKLRGAASPADLDRLVDASGGFFRLASLLVRQIQRAGRADWPREIAATIEHSRNWAGLEEGSVIFGYYKDDLDRTLTPEVRRVLPAFARLIVAARDWISERDASEILAYVVRKKNDHPGDFQELKTALTWLLSRRYDEDRDGLPMWYIQYQHPSVRDFLVSVKHDGPAADNPEERIPEMHLRMAGYFLSVAKNKGWDKVLRYGREHVVQHLFAGEKPKATARAVELLTSPEYLQATLGDEPPDEPF
jgi:hypothetical protein